jgi:hypothetical protein
MRDITASRIGFRASAWKNATERPSLVYTGRSAIVCPVVSGVGVPPATGTSQMCR